jgi:hypothetical protein
MASSHHPSEEPQKDMLIKSHFTPSLKSVLYNEQLRVKRITTALYVVTDHIDDLENLKRHIRQYATDLLKVSHVPYNANQEELEFRMSFILSYVDAIMSFIEIAFAGRYISEPNTQLLLRELRSLSIHMHHRYQDIVGHLSGQNEIYEDINIQHIFQDTPPNPTPTGSIKKDAKTTKASRSVPASQADTESEKKPKSKDTDANTQPAGSLASEPMSSREERKEHIIAVISYKQTASIKDIVTHIAGCSEKTLQRDIKDLIAEGRIIKEGSRRWSTYRIKE